MIFQRLRHPAVGPTVEQAAGLLFAHTAPLLEEKGGASLLALLTNLINPFLPHWPLSGTRFAANNHPIYLGQIKIIDGVEQRFQAEEAYPGRDFL